MSQRNCSKDGPTSSTNPEKPENIREGRILLLLLNLFCALFGDPHLRTFKDHFQTCKVEGAWPLIDNNYLSVQVTNVPVVPGSSATATNKKVYQAVTDDLPAAFVDGTTSGGDGNTKSLRIVEKVSGKYIKMHTRYIGTMVYILRLGHYLTLALCMAEELVMAYEKSQNLQLCVNGCPSSKRIDGNGPLPLSTATTKCQEKMLVKDIYFYSCVFDLLTTGDANFTAAYRITASQSYRMWRHCTPEKSTGISSPAVEVVVWARVANSLSVWDLCA
uniref:Repulsive guidance molecule C-terminal domain-containing protein n=1 Tax=Strix occidentalis caurina TaxID=311401 RepID=A0A8D0FYX3_STROC